MTPSPRDVPNVLSAIFAARTVAVVGASRDPQSMGGRLLANLRDSFRGRLFAVNPRGGASVVGVACRPSIGEVPSPVDVAFVVVPAPLCLDVVDECLSAGVQTLVVVTAGFSEMGETGRNLERRLVERTRAAGVRLVGPNCMGLLSTDPERPLHGTFADVRPPVGRVGVGTQSGALGYVVPDQFASRGIGLSSLVSLGNKADVDENDVLGFWEQDPRTSVGALYLESFADPRTFLERARRLVRRKPLVVLKAGRTPAGTRAAGSHTAALATPDALAEGLLRQAGAVRVRTVRELLDTTTLLASGAVPRGRRIAVLTNAGGPAVLCCDELAAHGLLVPDPPPELEADLRRMVRPESIVRNPVDLIGTRDPVLFGRCLRRLLEAAEFDAVVAIFVPLVPGDSEPVAREIRRVRDSLSHPAPLVAVFVDAQPPLAEPTAGDAPIPCFAFPEEAALALARCVELAERRDRPPGRPVECDDIDAAAIRRVIAESATGWLDPSAVHVVLAAIGLRFPKWAIAATPDAAAIAARDMDGPVVVKVVSGTVLHKARAGGVIVDVRGDAAVRDAFRRVTGVAPEQPAAALIQEHVRGGAELLLGLSRIDGFGAVIGCGPGGTSVESRGGVAFRLAPLEDRDATELVGENRSLQLPPGHVRVLCDAALRLSRLSETAPEIVELDLNPVRLCEDGSLLVLDARVRVGA